MGKRLLFAVLVAVMLAVGWIALDERTRLTVFKPNGFAQSGEVLGVAIGSARSDARVRLQNQGLAFFESQDGGTCFFREVPSGRQLDIYFIKSWHGGTFCVVSRREKIEELIWAFQPISL